MKVRICECWNGRGRFWISVTPPVNTSYDVYEVELPEGFTADEERGLIFRDGEPCGEDINTVFTDVNTMVWHNAKMEKFTVNAVKLNDRARYSAEVLTTDGDVRVMVNKEGE